MTLALVLSYWDDGTIGISMFGQRHLKLGWLPASQKMAVRNHDLKKERRQAEGKRGRRRPKVSKNRREETVI